MSAEDISNIEQFAENMKKQIGRVYTLEEFSASKPIYRQDYFNTQATRDAIRHFVDGIGDTNPLYRDRYYARKTKYGCLIAPPNFLQTISYSEHPEGIPISIGGVLSGSEWEWFRPVCEGDEFSYRVVCPSDIQLKASRSAGKLVILYQTGDLIRQGGDLIASYRSWIIYTKRRTNIGQSTIISNVKLPEYSTEDLNKIYTAQDNEIVRGAVPRYWEDVEVGDELPPVVRGPYTVSEKYAWFVGKGNPPICMSDRLSRLVVEQSGSKYVYDPDRGATFFGASFTGRPMQRIHDAGAQRDAWHNLVLTNWMGDDGFLWKSKMSVRGFNRLGDTTWCKAKIIRKYCDNAKYCVDVECWGENQRSEVTMPGSATVILPSRENGPVIYPEPQKITWKM